MPTFDLIVCQVVRNQREIIVQVEAETLEAAIERQFDDDAPHYDDPRWVEYSTLENEEVRQAKPAELEAHAAQVARQREAQSLR